MRTIGQASYERWCDLIGPSFSLHLFRAWDKLPAQVQDDWHNVGLAAVEQYALNNALHPGNALNGPNGPNVDVT